MAHHLTIADPAATDSNGVRPAAYIGPKAWHGLGTEMDRPVSIAEARPYLVQVESENLVLADGTPTGHRSLRRSFGTETGTKGPSLSVVGNQYRLQTQEEVIRHVQEFAAAMSDPENPGAVMGLHDPILSTALSIREGAEQIVTVALGDLVPDKNDYASFALMVFRYGTGVREVLWSGTRVVCANTFALALSTARDRLKVSHRGDLKGNTTDMIREFRALVSVDRALQEWLQRLRDIRVTADQALQVFTLLNSDASGKAPESGRKLAALNNMMRAYESAPGAEAGTARGIFEAVTYWGTHEASVKARTAGAEVLGGSVDSRYRALMPKGSVNDTILKTIDMIGELHNMKADPILLGR